MNITLEAEILETPQSRKLNRPKIDYVPNDEFHLSTEGDYDPSSMELYIDDGNDECTGDAEHLVWMVDHLRILSAEGEKFLFRRLNFLRFRASALQATLLPGKNQSKVELEVHRLLKESEETRNQIAVANLRLIRSLARRLSDSREEFDEFCAEAQSVLLKAIDKFDYSRGFRFSTYATHSVQRHLRRQIARKQKERSRTQSLQFADSSPSNSNLSQAAERNLFAAVAVIVDSFDHVLDGREKHIVTERFGLSGNSGGKSMKVIGDELGLSKERVRQLLQASLEKLAEVAKPFEIELP